MHINLIEYEKYWVSFDLESLEKCGAFDIRLVITFIFNNEIIYKVYHTNSFEIATKFLEREECIKTAHDIIIRAKCLNRSPFNKGK